MRRLTLLALLCVACTRSQAPVPTLTPVVTPVSKAARHQEQCVVDCVRRNMARAVAPEVIDSDCLRACTKPEEAPLEPKD